MGGPQSVRFPVCCRGCRELWLGELLSLAVSPDPVIPWLPETTGEALAAHSVEHVKHLDADEAIALLKTRDAS